MAQRVEREKVAEEGDLVNRQVISGKRLQKPGLGRVPGTSLGTGVPSLLREAGAKMVALGPKRAWKVHSAMVLLDEDDEAEGGEERESLNSLNMFEQVWTFEHVFSVSCIDLSELKDP